MIVQRARRHMAQFLKYRHMSLLSPFLCVIVAPLITSLALAPAKFTRHQTTLHAHTRTLPTYGTHAISQLMIHLVVSSTPVLWE
jgi:hypothetical protein